MATDTSARAARRSSPGMASPNPTPRRASYNPHVPSPIGANRTSRPSSPALLARKSSTTSLRAAVPSLGSPSSVSRRASYNLTMSSPKSPLGMQVREDEEEQKPPLRACDVAEEWFRKEMAAHEEGASAGTVVIVHDQCYGHRFSRPKTNKSTLSMIVERPERILATVLGISTAYVRLGERHADGPNPPHPHRSPPSRIPFKIRKTSRAVELTSPVVTSVHGTKWMEELKTMCTNAERKLASTRNELSREGMTMPGQPPKKNFHEGDLYLCSESLNALQGALGGTLDAVDAVFQGGSTGPSRAFVCVRPPGHHCSADWPSGFCWINNVHVGIEHAFQKYGMTHAAIIDFDLHHGDGSQAITWARNQKVQNLPKNAPHSKKTSIGYFSLHDVNSFPCEYGEADKVQAASVCVDNAHGQSVWNIHLEEWKTEADFWRLYEDKYLEILSRARRFLKHHTRRLQASPNHPPPKAAIFLSAGFDASEHESAGMQRHKVNVPTEFYARFTRDVVHLAEEEGNAVEGRIVSVLEGGYSNRALTSGVLSHLSGLCDGQVVSDAKLNKGLAYDLSEQLGGLSLDAEQVPIMYNPAWWHETALSELESLVEPPPAVIPKKPRTGPAPTYSSPTQSFTAKVVDTAKLHRSLSGRYTASPSRAPTPPPPEVEWATAAHSLSKLLIPSDRQIHSHKAEDLAEPKIKKERPAPVVTATHVDPSGRQLRGRKPARSYADESDDSASVASVRASSKARALRRQTIADLPPTPAPPTPTRSVSRRMSIASSVGTANGDRSVSRASSVAPGRKAPAPGAANAVQVKKPRAIATGPSRPPVPKVPTNYLKKGREKEIEIDEVTAKVKSLKINLPKPESENKRAPSRAGVRKAPVARVPAPKAASSAAKKAPGKLAKVSKPASPVEALPRPERDAAPIPEPPKIEHAATAILEQPRPVQPMQAPSVGAIAGPERRTSAGPIDPPTELTEISITPEQLPKPQFTTAIEPLGIVTSPPRPDTPPPPPPSSMPQFVNYNTQTFGTSTSLNEKIAAFGEKAPLTWLPPNSDTALPMKHAEPSTSRPASSDGTRQQLPVFSATSAIPFAPNPNVATALPPGSQVQPSAVAADDAIKTEPIKMEENDMWEVPETPAR